MLLTSSVYEGRLRRFQKMKIYILYRDIVLTHRNTVYGHMAQP